MRKLFLMCVLVVGCFGAAQESRAQFCPGVSPWVFDDVLASDPFCGYITEMAMRGVTLGCTIIDANHRLYCPSANVTRTQMAAFMSRLGGHHSGWRADGHAGGRRGDGSEDCGRYHSFRPPGAEPAIAGVFRRPGASPQRRRVDLRQPATDHYHRG